MSGRAYVLVMACIAIGVFLGLSVGEFMAWVFGP